MSDPSRRPPRSASPPEPPAVTLADLEEARALYAQLDPAWFDRANDPHGWLFEPEVQRLIAGIVDAEVAAFAALLPPEGLRVLREELELACHTDPQMIEYLDRIRPRGARDQSGKTRKGEFQMPPSILPFRKKAGGEGP